MDKRKKKTDKHTTSEKPISLEPLEFEEALRALLDTKPEKESTAQGEDKAPRKKKARRSEG